MNSDYLPFFALGGAVLLGAMVYFFNRLSRDIIFGVLALIFFLPFERIPSFDLAGFTLKLNHLVGLALIFWWFCARLVSKSRFLARNFAGFPMLALATVMFAGSAQAEFKSRALIFSALAIFTIWLAVVVNDSLRSKKDLEAVEKVVVWSAWLAVVFSLWQFVGDLLGAPLWLTGLNPGYSKSTFGFPRVQAFSKEPLYLGNWLFIPLAFLAARVFGGTNKIADKLLLLLVLLIFALTLSRGALLGLGVFALVLALAVPRKIFTPKVLSGSITALFLVLIVILGFLNFAGSGAKERFASHLLIKDFSFSESTVSRLSSVQVALDAWKTHPFVGVGMGNFGGFRVNYDAGDPKSSDIVNNEYLELLAETGILGLGSFLAIVAVVLRELIGAVRSSQDGFLRLQSGSLLAAVLAILTQYNFFSTLAIIHIWTLFGLCLAVARIAKTKAAR